LVRRDRADVQYRLALAFRSSGRGAKRDEARAARWFREAARRGHVRAQLELARLYSRGRGVPRDPQRAFYWFRKAAAQGNIAAQYNVGLIYRDGRTVAQDDVAAAKWLRRAAEHGSRNAQAILGVMYAKGQGVPADRARALEWLTRAAKQGHRGARRDRAFLLRHPRLGRRAGRPRQTGRRPPRQVIDPPRRKPAISAAFARIARPARKPAPPPVL